jgi:hypothetical protein
MKELLYGTIYQDGTMFRLLPKAEFASLPKEQQKYIEEELNRSPFDVGVVGLVNDTLNNIVVMHIAQPDAHRMLYKKQKPICYTGSNNMRHSYTQSVSPKDYLFVKAKPEWKLLSSNDQLYRKSA